MQQHCTVHSLEEEKKKIGFSPAFLLWRRDILTVCSSESRDRERIVIKILSFIKGLAGLEAFKSQKKKNSTTNTNSNTQP